MPADVTKLEDLIAKVLSANTESNNRVEGVVKDLRGDVKDLTRSHSGLSESLIRHDERLKARELADADVQKKIGEAALEAKTASAAVAALTLTVNGLKPGADAGQEALKQVQYWKGSAAILAAIWLFVQAVVVGVTVWSINNANKPVPVVASPHVP